MSRQRTIITTIPISSQGEIKHFQVKIPDNAAFITGIETGVRVKQPLKNFIPPTERKERISPPVNPFSNIISEVLVGELKLQSCEEANIFYSAEVKERNEEIQSAEGLRFYKEKSWTHGLKRQLDKITVDGETTILSGIYKDRISEMLKRDIPYEVNIYVWYEMRSSSGSNSQKQILK